MATNSSGSLLQRSLYTLQILQKVTKQKLAKLYSMFSSGLKISKFPNLRSFTNQNEFYTLLRTENV